MAQEMNQESVDGFTGSTAWLYRFMKRKNLVFRQKMKIAQRFPQELKEKIINFQRMIIRMKQKRNYEKQKIGNMDETPMNLDMPQSRTVNPVVRRLSS